MSPIILLDKVSENIDKWKELKKGRIGGSQIGTILGLNPFESPLQLWCEFTGRTEPKEENHFMRQGRRLEPVIAEMFKERFPDYECTPVNQLWGYSGNDKFIVTPDYKVTARDLMAENLLGLTEFKVSRLKGNWGEDTAPDAALVQLHWQLGIGGIKKGWVCGMTGLYEDSFFTPCFEFSPAIFGNCIGEAQKFLDDVKSDTPPSARAGDDKLISALISKDTDEKAILLDAESLTLCQNFDKLDKERLELNKRVEDLKKKAGVFKVELVKKLGKSRCGISGDYHVNIYEKEVKGFYVNPRTDIIFKLKNIAEANEE